MELKINSVDKPCKKESEDIFKSTHVLCSQWRGFQTRAGSARKGCEDCPAEAASRSAQTDKTGYETTVH